MNRSALKINHIPAIIWGDISDKLFIAVHGDQSNKADIQIEIFAKEAVRKGFQVLSFDLPEHGDRKAEATPCKVQNCVEELHIIMDYAKKNWSYISLFANSMGTYFSLLAYREEPLERCLLLSPLVDMERMITNMMTWFTVSEARLQEEKEIVTPIGKTIYWDYYTYVKEHPVDKWNVLTAILCGTEDDICEYDTIVSFVKRFGANLERMEGGEHYFHTKEQLAYFNLWLEKNV